MGRLSPDGKPLLGRKVIVINNEPVPPLIGTIVRFEPITRAMQLVPIIRNDATGQELLCLGTVLPYNDRLLAMLKAVPEDGKTWEVFREIRWLRLDMDHYCEVEEGKLKETAKEPQGFWEKFWSRSRDFWGD